jgi:hypothetical protein
LLHFAFMQVNARTEHVRKLKFRVRSSKFQVDREQRLGAAAGCGGAHSRTAPERGCVEDQPQPLRKTSLLEYT